VTLAAERQLCTRWLCCTSTSATGLRTFGATTELSACRYALSVDSLRLGAASQNAPASAITAATMPANNGLRDHARFTGMSAATGTGPVIGP